MSDKIRVRFAPSPTGALHIGGLRTALFNYLFAKKHGGDFILRIEDTDQTRYVEGAEQYIIEALNWCNIPFDEGIGKEIGSDSYRQSERKEIYAKHIQDLIDKEMAYYAFDTAEELDQLRVKSQEQGKTFIYNWSTRNNLKNALTLPAEKVTELISQGVPYVVRFKTPYQRTLVMNDLIRGEVSVDTSILDDKVLFKSDGMPTYHLANIVDDHLMRITHVIRGEEWLPSMALHQLIYEAFGWKAPEFAHLPLILNPNGKGKLSKRDGQKYGFPVFPLQWKDGDTVVAGFREDGYLPEALVNFLALLGWNSGDDKEIFSMEELIVNFDLTRVNKSGARFDFKKINWFNQQYLQKKSNEELCDLFLKDISKKGISLDRTKALKIVELTKDRVTFVSDFYNLGNFFFEAPASFDDKAMKKQCKENTPDILQDILKLIENTSDFIADNIESEVKRYILDSGLSVGQVMPVLRLSLVGEMKGPDVFQIMEVIGKSETFNRISFFIKMISK